MNGKCSICSVLQKRRQAINKFPQLITQDFVLGKRLQKFFCFSHNCTQIHNLTWRKAWRTGQTHNHCKHASPYCISPHNSAQNDSMPDSSNLDTLGICLPLQRCTFSNHLYWSFPIHIKTGIIQSNPTLLTTEWGGHILNHSSPHKRTALNMLSWLNSSYHFQEKESTIHHCQTNIIQIFINKALSTSFVALAQHKRTVHLRKLSYRIASRLLHLILLVMWGIIRPGQDPKYVIIDAGITDQTAC